MINWNSAGKAYQPVPGVLKFEVFDDAGANLTEMTTSDVLQSAGDYTDWSATDNSRLGELIIMVWGFLYRYFISVVLPLREAPIKAHDVPPFVGTMSSLFEGKCCSSAGFSSAILV